MGAVSKIPSPSSHTVTEVSAGCRVTFSKGSPAGEATEVAGATPHSPRGEIPPIAGEMSAKQTKGAWVRRTAIASFDGRGLSKVLLRYS